MLGSFRVLRGDQPLNVSLSCQRLLALLALARHPVTRERISGTLWPQASRHSSQASLRSTLWRLGTARAQLLMAADSLIGLADDCDVDLYRAEGVGVALTNRNWSGDDHQALLQVFSNDLLVDWYEPWLELDREIYRETRVHALEALAREFLATNRTFFAIRACLEAIRSDPFRDTSHELLVEAYVAEGNVAAALTHIRRYRATVSDELRVAPEKILARVEGQIMGLSP